MRILFGILLGLLAIHIGLAIAFLQPEQSLAFEESLNMEDSISYTLHKGG